ncbi:DUF3883 domain-containing protein [Methylobacter sp. BlB1]|uniref:DUF3883 domain-containing protein n=1 Tax=Methylobacter sp. BlB1 TaxID=2785914 RepID=UPI001895C51A|nr:DUF3883 domain-containing protein [Methylobacter sp. BlB1]MBF6650217.1 DUF3883 domain-containing protein [Methylobacter sp. BlB1]
MASNYQAICEENQKRYGTDIGRIGPMLLADRYDDRTHFIFELLQNAEDALARRGDWTGQRSVSFQLTERNLSLRHFGKPFDEADVRGVCGIAESTKDENSIGRFGIGFKSVYTFTDRPEIHSGDEDFAVENYVQPTWIERKQRSSDETLIVLPLKPEDRSAHEEITDGFKKLGADALLFLRHINEINWSVDGNTSGVYLRSAPVSMGPNVQHITVIGQESDQPEIDQNWLVFHHEVMADGQEKVGRVEVAFSILPDKNVPDRWAIQPVKTSPLVVFFPTVVSTNLGFLVQGPYRTTPSRDNILRSNPWNQYLVKETAALLVEALRWLRDQKMLDTSTLRCLPLEREKFPKGSIFAPLFDAVKEALMNEALLPCFDGGYVPAKQTKLARTKELRELFSPQQIAVLFGEDVSAWLSGDITQDRTPEIRQYIIHELAVAEITPQTILRELNKEFLEAQTDDWVLRLYEYLNGQEAALRRHLDTTPLIRLKDGTHVVVRENGRPNAFLPSAIETGFPTMRKEVCKTREARLFLISLGITEPDPVDDVIWNILPRFRQKEVNIAVENYTRDIERIQAAFNTDSKLQRDKLLKELQGTPFVIVVDAGDRTRYVSKPGDCYLATDRLKQLFAGIHKVFIVDDSYACLRGENIRELLEACGAVRCPRPVEAPYALTYDQRRALRQQAGHEALGRWEQIKDWNLHGFDDLINMFHQLECEERIKRARLIWESLGDLEERRGRGVFEGRYEWTHHGSYKAEFPSAFLRQLNTVSWIPDANGELQRPDLVVFDTLGWKANPFLLTKITFKPPIIEQLAKEAGIDPALLDLLKKHGITSEAEFKSRLGITEQPSEPEVKLEPTQMTSDNVYDDAKDLYGDMSDFPLGDPDPSGGDNIRAGGANDGRNGSTSGAGNSREGGRGADGGSPDTDGKTGSHGGTGGGTHGKRSPGHAGGRPFISYVGTHLDEEESDPDGLDQAARMKIEELAIQKIIKIEPKLNRTPVFNPGYDLYEKGIDGQPIRWVEVKAMSGTLADRPVGLSKKQFVEAQKRGSAYWLYVVEQASDPDKFRILRIQDPVTHARTFTFDHGWIGIAK